MVLYICSLCNKKFNHKGDYTRHINRKNKCKIIPSNNNNIVIKKKEETFQNRNSSKHICNYCNRSYSRRPNLNKHLKTCKVKKDNLLVSKINDLNIIIEQQNKNIEDLQEKTKGNIKIYDVKDIIKSLRKDIKLNRSEIVDLKYKT